MGSGSGGRSVAASGCVPTPSRVQKHTTDTDAATLLPPDPDPIHDVDSSVDELLSSSHHDSNCSSSRPSELACIHGEHPHSTQPIGDHWNHSPAASHMPRKEKKEQVDESVACMELDDATLEVRVDVTNGSLLTSKDYFNSSTTSTASHSFVESSEHLGVGSVPCSLVSNNGKVHQDSSGLVAKPCRVQKHATDTDVAILLPPDPDPSTGIACTDGETAPITQSIWDNWIRPPDASDEPRKHTKEMLKDASLLADKTHTLTHMICKGVTDHFTLGILRSYHQLTEVREGGT